MELLKAEKLPRLSEDDCAIRRNHADVPPSAALELPTPHFMRLAPLGAAPVPSVECSGNEALACRLHDRRVGEDAASLAAPVSSREFRKDGEDWPARLSGCCEYRLDCAMLAARVEVDVLHGA